MRLFPSSSVGFWIDRLIGSTETKNHTPAWGKWMDQVSLHPWGNSHWFPSIFKRRTNQIREGLVAVWLFNELCSECSWLLLYNNEHRVNLESSSCFSLFLQQSLSSKHSTRTVTEKERQDLKQLAFVRKRGYVIFWQEVNGEICSQHGTECLVTNNDMCMYMQILYNHWWQKPS